MKTFLWLTGSGAFFLLVWSWWFSSIPRLWNSLGVRPPGGDAVWRQVHELLEAVSREYRLPAPRLWLLPEFSPNALVLRDLGGKNHLALSEGLVRVLNAEELEAVLALCLVHGHRPGRAFHTWIALLLFPFARWFQGYPLPFQLLLAPWFSLALRAVSRPGMVLKCDQLTSKKHAPLLIAASLQKMAVLSRKVPIRHWNFALDSLFLLSPLALDGSPFWVFLTQPSVEVRRSSLLRNVACESSATLS